MEYSSWGSCLNSQEGLTNVFNGPDNKYLRLEGHQVSINKYAFPEGKRMV